MVGLELVMQKVKVLEMGNWTRSWNLNSGLGIQTQEQILHQIMDHLIMDNIQIGQMESQITLILQEVEKMLYTFIIME